MQQIKIKTPAKINLTLEILNKREDGFHNIQSIMQMIDLFDYLTINIEEASIFEIKLSGTSDKIPYDEKNIVHKAILAFVEYTNISPHRFEVYIEKNIPTEAGLAGGSSNAAGTIFALNKLFSDKLSEKELHLLCSKLGSDLNVCLKGGCILATGRGEKVEALPFINSPVSLIKPKYLGISAKEGYQAFAELENKPNLNNTEKMIKALKTGQSIENLLHNDLEYGVFTKYKKLQTIKKAYPNSIMSGSGSTYFVLQQELETELSSDFWTKSELKFINTGVQIC